VIAEVHLELLVSRAWSLYAGSQEVFDAQFVGIPEELLVQWREEINAKPPTFLTRGSKGTGQVPSVEFHGVEERAYEAYLGDDDQEGAGLLTDARGCLITSRVTVTVKGLSASQARTLYLLARAILLANKRALMSLGYADVAFEAGTASAGSTDTEAEGRGTFERAFTVAAIHELTFTPAADSATDYPWTVEALPYDPR
jgi:hypothetical protein